MERPPAAERLFRHSLQYLSIYRTVSVRAFKTSSFHRIRTPDCSRKTVFGSFLCVTFLLKLLQIFTRAKIWINFFELPEKTSPDTTLLLCLCKNTRSALGICNFCNSTTSCGYVCPADESIASTVWVAARAVTPTIFKSAKTILKTLE